MCLRQISYLIHSHYQLALPLFPSFGGVSSRVSLPFFSSLYLRNLRIFSLLYITLSITPSNLSVFPITYRIICFPTSITSTVLNTLSTFSIISSTRDLNLSSILYIWVYISDTTPITRFSSRWDISNRGFSQKTLAIANINTCRSYI